MDPSPPISLVVLKGILRECNTGARHLSPGPPLFRYVAGCRAIFLREPTADQVLAFANDPASSAGDSFTGHEPARHAIR
jgi:hypothetical protein